MSKTYAVIYASVFSGIWIIYGIVALLRDYQSAEVIFGFGLAFAGMVWLTTWFSKWLMKYYKTLDEIREKELKRKQRTTS